MKKIFLIIMLLLISVPGFAANQTLPSQTADTSPTTDDLMYTVNDPGGTPADRKVTLGNLKTLIQTSPSITSPTVTGSASFATITASVGVSVADDAYDATTWNSSILVPTKNAIRDKIETLTASGGGWTDGGTIIAPTTTSDSVAIGGTTSSSPIYLAAAGTGSFQGGLIVGNATDSDQTIVRVDIASTDPVFAYSNTNHRFTMNYPLEVTAAGPMLLSQGMVCNNDQGADSDHDCKIYGDTLLLFRSDSANDKIIGLGTWDLSGASILRVPIGTAPTIATAGDAGVDTTANQWKFYSSSAVRVIPTTLTRCRAKDDVTSADDNMSLGMWGYPVTITGVACSYNGTGTTVATFTLEDGSGNAMTITGTNPTCVAHGTNATFAAVTAANTIVSGEILRFDTTNTPSPTTDDYTICVNYTVDAQ